MILLHDLYPSDRMFSDNKISMYQSIFIDDLSLQQREKSVLIRPDMRSKIQVITIKLNHLAIEITVDRGISIYDIVRMSRHYNVNF